ncbi:MAG: hypothetical protein MJK04_19830 [Psychrosphaera sp.]|nr:hypothetical protein [Psychrosphaera sp.]
MAYTKTQFVSYQLNTFTSYINTTGQWTYMGNTDSDTDIDYRVKVMIKCIDEASKSSQIDGDSSTLKIFMAPEFYFRGLAGAYPVEKLSTIMDKLRNHTKASGFKDWLFVFGTAIGWMEVPTAPNRKEIINAALVQKGGISDAQNDTSKIVMKEYISHIDFARQNPGQDWNIANNRLGVVGANPLTSLTPVSGSKDLNTVPSTATDNVHERSSTGYGGGCLFTMDGIEFALEICLDHLKGRVKSYADATQHLRVPQVHLITSAGAHIVQQNVFTVQNGLVFNVDGNGKSDININIGTNSIPAMCLNDKQLKHTFYLADAIHLWGTTGVYPTDWNTYYKDKGAILIYKSMPLPASVIR